MSKIRDITDAIMSAGLLLQLKEKKRLKGEYIHVSAHAKMIHISDVVHPWIERPGVTYYQGRNDAKRVRRGLTPIQPVSRQFICRKPI